MRSIDPFTIPSRSISSSVSAPSTSTKALPMPTTSTVGGEAAAGPDTAADGSAVPSRGEIQGQGVDAVAGDAVRSADRVDGVAPAGARTEQAGELVDDRL